MMADLRWSFFDELQKFADTIERQLNRWRSGLFGSPVDASVGSADDGYRVQIPLPGIAPENIMVDVTGRTVHVRAVERDGDSQTTCYEEVFTVPASVDVDKIGASYRHGLLELTLPYQESMKPRRIEITSGQAKQLKAA
jgi:HSP20 family protein